MLWDENQSVYLSGTAMPRANPKLSADERAFRNRLDCLNEEEIKQLTTRELFAYFKVIDKGTREVNRRLRNGRTH